MSGSSASTGEEARTVASQCAPLGAQGLTDAQAVAAATLFKALAEPARVRIVNILATADEPICACAFNAPLGLTQPTVSHHLSTLLASGLVTRERRGRWSYYALEPEALCTLALVADISGA